MQKNFSSKWSWWAYVLLVLGVIILVFPLIWLLVVELTDYFHFNGGTSADHTAISTAIAALIAGIVTVFGVAIAIIAGFYAKGQLLAGQEQLVTAQKFAHHDYLLRLDEAFRQYQDIRQKLRKGGDWYEGTHGPHFPEDLAVVEGYLALFERVQALIDDGILDIKSVERWYGDRLYNIVINKTIYNEKLIKRGKGWSGFIKLWDAIEQEREKSERWRPPGRPLPKDLPEKLRAPEEDSSED